jgi:basic membrane protein A
MKKIWVSVVILVMVGLSICGCAPKTTDCKLPETFCVGLVTDGGRVADRAYNQAAWDGIQQAQADGVADGVAFIETIDARDYEENIRVFTDAGYDVIVTVGSAMGDSTRAAAQIYPDSYFIGVDQDQLAGQEFSPNLTGLVFAEDQIGFLAGALAAMMTNTGQIGAVCASDELAFMKRYGEGYRAGAAYVNMDVVVTVVYHNDVGFDKTFIDPEWGAATANSLIDAGTDIIFGVGCTTGSNAIVAAAMRGVYGIGADTDQYFALPVAAPRLYSSVVKLIAPGITELIKIAKNAQGDLSAFPSGDYIGQVKLASYHELDSSIPDEVKSRMSELNRALLSGEIQTGVSIIYP